MEGDAEANYAYYALHKLNIKPREFVEMDRYERGFIMAATDIKLENDRKRAAEIKK